MASRKRPRYLVPLVPLLRHWELRWEASRLSLEARRHSPSSNPRQGLQDRLHCLEALLPRNRQDKNRYLAVLQLRHLNQRNSRPLYLVSHSRRNNLVVDCLAHLQPLVAQVYSVARHSPSQLQMVAYSDLPRLKYSMLREVHCLEVAEPRNQLARVSSAQLRQLRHLQVVRCFNQQASALNLQKTCISKLKTVSTTCRIGIRPISFIP